MTIRALSFKLLIPLIFFNFISCKSQYTKWINHVKIENIEFKKIRYKVVKSDTLLLIGLLKNESVIDNYPCAADWVHLSKKFKLQLFKLSSDISIEKLRLHKDTWVSLEKNAWYQCVFPKDTIIQGFKCMAGSGPDGISTNFDYEGNLRSFFSPDDIKIGKIFCSGGKNNQIGLLKNGSLEYCRLAIDHNINDIKYKQDQILHFDYNGNVSYTEEKYK